ncbi:DUF4304 domain-containing protein [Stenotrophomonas maltophilia]|uniref:DUF4304 domain-containing protein n=1 Tax=Stenotrophomonas maltophilia TaxID=40324 RepID=UPI0039C2BCFA
MSHALVAPSHAQLTFPMSHSPIENKGMRLEAIRRSSIKKVLVIIRSATIFGRCAKRAGFAGTTTTRYRQLGDISLVANHQGSRLGRGFYVNLGVYFSAILDQPLSPMEMEGALKERSTTPCPHVLWRIENTPGLSRPFMQEDLDALLKAGNAAGIEDLLNSALADALKFVSTQVTRESVRHLSRECRFSAIILKEV